jgi:hypothetical protein
VTPDRRNQSPKTKAKICLKRVAKICNGKDLLIQMGNTFGENKREAKPLKEQRKESGWKKVRFHENENSNPIPIRATKTNGTRDD